MTDNKEANKEWDVFAENHFLGRRSYVTETEAVATGVRLFGSHLEGILKAQPRVQRVDDGWSRPI